MTWTCRHAYSLIRTTACFPCSAVTSSRSRKTTPLDQEVALDPELLGRVFENLLAAYNPETRQTARKATGSYYTPRHIVDYMVEEALAASLAEKSRPTDDDIDFWRARVRYSSRL